MALSEDLSIPLVIVGYDFRKAPARLRSHLATALGERNDLFRQVRESGAGLGLTVLDTCNRTEWILHAPDPRWTGQIIKARLMARLQEHTRPHKPPEPYVHHGEEALRHLLRVASGLESFVLGERQIHRQVNLAFNEARDNLRSSDILNGLQSICGKGAHEAQRVGLTHEKFRGVHDLAVHVLSKEHPPAEPMKVVVYGLGEIGKRVVGAVRARTKWTPVLCNRTLPRQSRETVHPHTELPALLNEAKALIVCTGAFQKTVTPDHLTARSASDRLTVIDLGIPNQVDPDCAQVVGIRRLDLDALQSLTDTGFRNYARIQAVESLLDSLVGEFNRYCEERWIVSVLRTIQDRQTAISREDLPELIESLLPDLDPGRKRKLLFKLRGLFRNFSNSIFDAIHSSTTNDGEIP